MPGVGTFIDPFGSDTGAEAATTEAEHKLIARWEKDICDPGGYNVGTIKFEKLTNEYRVHINGELKATLKR